MELWIAVHKEPLDEPMMWCLACVYREGTQQDDRQYPTGSIPFTDFWHPKRIFQKVQNTGEPITDEYKQCIESEFNDTTPRDKCFFPYKLNKK